MRCLSKKSRLGTVVHAYNPATRQSLTQEDHQSEASMVNLVKIKYKF